MLQNDLLIQHLESGLRVPESKRQHRLSSAMIKDFRMRETTEQRRMQTGLPKGGSIGLPRVKKQRYNTPSSRAAGPAVGCRKPQALTAQSSEPLTWAPNYK